MARARFRERCSPITFWRCASRRARGSQGRRRPTVLRKVPRTTGGRMTKSRSELDPLIVARGCGAMTARGKKDRPDAQSSESTIYLDRDAVGSILVVKKGRVTA